MVTGVFGMVVTGVTGLGNADGTGVTGDGLNTGVVGVARGRDVGVGVGVAGVVNEDLEVPKRLAARIYCVRAAFCSGVAVLFATACKIALNSGLVAAISVNALTVRLFAVVIV